MLEQPIIGQAGERGIHGSGADPGFGGQLVAVAPTRRIGAQGAQERRRLLGGVPRSAHTAQCRRVSRYILPLNGDLPPPAQAVSATAGVSVAALVDSDRRCGAEPVGRGGAAMVA
jgi:hypothetical protein